MTPQPHSPPAQARSFHRILVATDFYPGSKRAFRKALELARDLGAELRLLHVWAVPQTRAVFFISISPESRATVRQRHRAKTRRRFEDFLRGEALEGVRWSTHFLEGRPHEEIVRYAEQEGIDLIVVGERPETRAQHLLQHLAFESVGERVRRTAPCPVLTVR
ncbi:MAG: universal stress protein [Deferrisomatales bacterium]